MIVWGGYRPGDIYLNSGGEGRSGQTTKPEADQHEQCTYGAIFAHGAVDRHCHARLGVDAPFFANTGGRYDPITDSWTTM